MERGFSSSAAGGTYAGGVFLSGEPARERTRPTALAALPTVEVSAARRVQGAMGACGVAAQGRSAQRKQMCCACRFTCR